MKNWLNIGKCMHYHNKILKSSSFYSFLSCSHAVNLSFIFSTILDLFFLDVTAYLNDCFFISFSAVSVVKFIDLLDKLHLSSLGNCS